MTEEDDARLDFAYEIQQVLAVGVRGEIEVLHFAPASDLAGGGAKEERFARPGSFQVAARGIGIGVADEEDGVAFIAHHAQGQVEGSGVLAHHARGDDEEAAAGKPVSYT